MKRPLSLSLSLVLVISSQIASAGFTETLPAKTFMLDVAHNHAWLKNGYDNEGNKTQLIDTYYRYEPGGGLQGIIIPDASVTYDIVVPQLRYGILDYLSVAVAVPIVARSTVKPRLSWVSGDYFWPLGRAYSESDFWTWADSMGQPKPGGWSGNRGVLSDIVLGFRYRFSEHLKTLSKYGIALAMTIFGALPTGRQKDPELVTATGTTSWELNFQGELGIHLSLDKSFKSLDNRLLIGLDLFYEVFFKHTYDTARGTVNPLISNFQPYVGDTYALDPGDFKGISLQVDVVPWRGPARGNWLTRGSAEKAAKLPPLLTLSFRYTYTHVGQSDWQSNSALWDWEQEKMWRPGYKNRLSFTMLVSLLRVAVPLQIYVSYNNLSWIPGKNVRAADVLSVGVRAPLKFW